MSEKVKWYACKRDIGITLLLMIFGYFSWPWILKGKIDAALLVYVYIAFLVFIECLLICRNHFWVWTGIALYGITAACGLGVFSGYYTSIANKLNLGMATLFIARTTLHVFVSLLPIVAPMAIFVFRSREKPTRVSAYLLLLPIGWLAGIVFADICFYDKRIFNLAMGSAFWLAVFSVIIITKAVKEHDNTTDMQKRTFLKWLSILSWLPAGLIPGFILFGMKYSLFATVLPVAAIYYFFELSKQREVEKPNETERC